jgi:signal transduction histidine kinase
VNDSDDSRLPAEEHAALRRLAKVLAAGASPAEVFEAVCAEIGGLFAADAASLNRYESDHTATLLGFWDAQRGFVAEEMRFALEPGMLVKLIAGTGRPGRVHYSGTHGSLVLRRRGWRSAVGAPITVDGRLWGAVAVNSTSDRGPPAGTEERLAEFTELVASAVANAQARADLEQLVEEQAGLRRVATLVAEGASPPEVSEAVCTEVGHALAADGATLGRFETDGTVTTLGRWTAGGGYRPMSSRTPSNPGLGAGVVLATGRPTRVPDLDILQGPLAAEMRAVGFRSGVLVPIVVNGTLWGLAGIMSRGADAMPPDTEARLAQFTEPAATAIANAESRAELAMSRTRIVTTADATRRRIERDLHDGAQQQLVTLAVELRLAQAALPPGLDDLRQKITHVVLGLDRVMDELREIAHGIHPGILAHGLGSALEALARRSVVPVELDFHQVESLPEPVEVAVYYVVAEALANAAKHAEATRVSLDGAVGERALQIRVRDDGLGGADAALGSGLLGLRDRVEAIGGTLTVQSPRGGGTVVEMELPLEQRWQCRTTR